MSTRVPTPLRVVLDASAIPLAAQGAGNYVLELVAALRRRSDLELTCVARRDDGARWRADGGGGVAPIAPRRRAARLVWGELALGRRVERLPGAPQVFHGPHYSLPARLGLPAVVTVHDLTFLSHPEWHEPAKVRFFSRALRVAASRAAVIVCVSERTRDELLAHLRPAGEVLVAPHGIDHRRFSPTEPTVGFDAAVRARHGLRGRYVMHLGTIEPRKNVDGLVRAFSRLAADRPDLELVLVGRRGWGTEALDRALSSLDRRDAVRELGYLDGEEVAALLRGAACVAYPSRAEGFGLPALEALACGAPLVTTADTPMSDVAGPAALTVAVGDEDGLAAALAAALDDAPGRARRRALGLEVASAASWEASAAVHAEAYRHAATR